MVRIWGFLALCAGFAFLIAGCSSSSAPTVEEAGKDEKRPEEHVHKPGQHGGIIVTIGRDSYHAEAVFEKGGVLRLLMLDKDETKVLEVGNQTLTAYVKRAGADDSVSIVLKPEQQPGDAQGMTSQFVGRLPRELTGQQVEVTIPSLTIAGSRFRAAFQNFTEGGDGHAAAMPAKVENDEEQKLYLTPEGKYTASDIEANGKVTASKKFRGVKAAHDLKPRKGEKICPITLTKANPKFTWTVDGKGYEFCCPPCVDEFVKLAKEKPDEVKAPDGYIKR